MTVYVDEIINYPGKGEWCHLMTDDPTLDELHAMAEKIGLRRDWFQAHRDHPHYDLRPATRALAILNGAVPADSMDMLTRWRNARGREWG